MENERLEAGWIVKKCKSSVQERTRKIMVNFQEKVDQVELE